MEGKGSIDIAVAGDLVILLGDDGHTGEWLVGLICDETGHLVSLGLLSSHLLCDCTRQRQSQE